ncbi:hypothetical protein C8J56DRAFT_1110700 [Mycena floridula]|nr:hypothetical protein C8J56DRAFT_1110700 [Mycena floridula]
METFSARTNMTTVQSSGTLEAIRESTPSTNDDEDDDDETILETAENSDEEREITEQLFREEDLLQETIDDLRREDMEQFLNSRSLSLVRTFNVPIGGSRINGAGYDTHHRLLRIPIYGMKAPLIAWIDSSLKFSMIGKREFKDKFGVAYQEVTGQGLVRGIYRNLRMDTPIGPTISRVGIMASWMPFNMALGRDWLRKNGISIAEKSSNEIMLVRESLTLPANDPTRRMSAIISEEEPHRLKSICAISYARELEKFYSELNSSRPTLNARVNLLRSSIGKGPPFDSRPRPMELEAVKVSEEKKEEMKSFDKQLTLGGKFIATRGPRGKFLALVEPSWKHSYVREELVSIWGAIMSEMEEGKKSVSVTLLIDAEPNDINTAIVLTVKHREQIPADIVLGKDWVERYVHREINKADSPYLEIINLMTRTQGYAYVIDITTANKNQDIFDAYNKVRRSVMAVDAGIETHNEDSQDPKVWKGTELEKISVKTSVNSIQAVRDATLDSSLVQFSIARNNFSNPIIVTGQSTLEAGIVRNEEIEINGRRIREDFSVIYDNNLGCAMVLGRRVLVNLYLKEDTENHLPAEIRMTENNMEEIGASTNQLVEPIGNGYRMTRPIWEVWQIQIEIGGSSIWAVLDPYSRLSYIQYEVKQRLLRQVRMDTNHEVSAHGTMGVLRDVVIIKKQQTKVDLRVLKKGFATNPVKLGQDWLERNKIGIQWYQGQNHLFFPEDAVVPDNSSIMGHTEGMTAGIHESNDAQRKQEIIEQRAARKEEKRKRKTRARERKEKQEGRTLFSQEGTVKTGFKASGHRVQKGVNWYKYPGEKDLWKRALEREYLKTGARALMVRIGWVDFLALLEPSWPQSYLSSEFVNEWNMTVKEGTYLIETKVYAQTRRNETETQGRFAVKPMSELPATVVLGGDWFNEHVEAIYEGRTTQMQIFNGTTRITMHVWELGKMELARRNYQELQDIRMVKWEPSNTAYPDANQGVKQYWERPPMQKVTVETEDDQRIWAVIDKKMDENLVKCSVAQRYFKTGIHTIGENLMVAGMILGEKVCIGDGNCWKIDFKVVFDSHLAYDIVLGRQVSEEMLKVDAQNSPTEIPETDDEGEFPSEPEDSNQAVNGEETTEQESDQDQDQIKERNKQDYSQVQAKNGDLRFNARRPKGVQQLKIEMEQGDLLEPDSEDKVLNDLTTMRQNDKEPTIIKEAVKLLDAKEYTDQEGQTIIKEDFMVTPIIGMKITMGIKDQANLPAKAILGQDWIKSYVARISLDSNLLWIGGAEEYRQSFVSIFDLKELSRIKQAYQDKRNTPDGINPYEQTIMMAHQSLEEQQPKIADTLKGTAWTMNHPDTRNDTRPHEHKVHGINGDQTKIRIGNREEIGTQTDKAISGAGNQVTDNMERPLVTTSLKNEDQMLLTKWNCWLCSTNEHRMNNCPEMESWAKFSYAVRNYRQRTEGRSVTNQNFQEEEEELDYSNSELTWTEEQRSEKSDPEVGISTDNNESKYSWGDLSGVEDSMGKHEGVEEENPNENQTWKRQESIKFDSRTLDNDTNEGSYDVDWELERAILKIMDEQVTIGLVNAQENVLVMDRESPEEELTAGKIRRSYLQSLQSSLKELETKMEIRVAERYKRQLALRDKIQANSATKEKDKPRCLVNQVMPPGRLSDLQYSIRHQNPQILDECSDFLTFPFQYYENNRTFHPDGEVLTGTNDPNVHDKLNHTFIRALTSRQERSTPPHFLAILSTEAISFRRNRIGYKELDEIVAFGATVIRGAGNKFDQPISVEKGNFHSFFYPYSPSGEELNFPLDFPNESQCQVDANPDRSTVSGNSDSYDASVEDELAEKLSNDTKVQQEKETVVDSDSTKGNLNKQVQENSMEMLSYNSPRDEDPQPFPQLVQCLELDEEALERAIMMGPAKDRMRGRINIEYILSVVGCRDARDFFQWVREEEDCKEICQKNKFGKWLIPVCKVLFSGQTISLLQPYFLSNRFRILPPPHELRNFGSTNDYEMSETWQEEVDNLYLLIRNLEMCGIAFPVDKVNPPTVFRDDISDSSDDDDETMSTGSDSSEDRERHEEITSAFVEYAEISKFIKKAAGRLKKRHNPYRSDQQSKKDLPESMESDIHTSLQSNNPTTERVRKESVGHQEEELRYLSDSDEDADGEIDEFFRTESTMHNQRPGEQIVGMDRLPSPSKSVTLHAEKVADKLQIKIPADPRIHSPIPVRVFNVRTIKKPIIPELTEEEKIAPQYAKRTGGPPLPRLSTDSDEMPELVSLSNSSSSTSSGESFDMDVDQLADNDSDSSHEENNDGYSILRDKRGRVFLRDPMQQDSDWESDEWEESDKEFKRFLDRLTEQTRELNRSFSEALKEKSGIKAPVSSPIADAPIPPPVHIEPALGTTVLIKPIDAQIIEDDIEPTNERDEFGYTDYRNFQRFVVNAIPRELSRFNSYEPIPPGHPSLAGVDVLGVGCYQYFHGAVDNHPLRRFDNAASIFSIVHDQDQLDELRNCGLVDRIVNVKRYMEDIIFNIQDYQERITVNSSSEERVFITFQVHAMRAELNRKERDCFMDWGSGDARPFTSIFDKNSNQLLPIDPTLSVTMMHLYRTATETYVVDMRDKGAIERADLNHALWSRKDEYLDPEKSGKVEIRHNAWIRHKWVMRHIRSEVVEVLQELILIMEEPFSMTVIMEEIKLNTTAGHYWTLHCPYLRIIDNRYSEHFQGLNRECYHLDSMANVQTQILLRKPLQTHNPFITEDEDEFLYHCAKVLDESSVTLGNAVRNLREVDILMAEDVRILLSFNHLDNLRFYDHFGKKYAMIWGTF